VGVLGCARLSRTRIESFRPFHSIRPSVACLPLVWFHFGNCTNHRMLSACLPAICTESTCTYCSLLVFATLASLPILSANSSTSASPTSIALPHLHDTVWIRLLSLDSLRLLLLHGIWLSDTACVPAPDLHRLMNTARFDLPKPS